jgi:hypothetical protein
MDLPKTSFMIRPSALLLLLWACIIPLAHGSSLQEQAEFLAGIPLPRESLLSPLQKSPEYRDHQRLLQEQWAFCRRIRYAVMQQWGREHLALNPASRGVLRYLFGGPDFLNAYAFFPDTRVMVLGGLEPVGDLPPPEALDPTALGAALKSLDEALHTSLFCGYFITSEMKPQLAKSSFQGVIPVLFTELALTGNIIESTQMIRPFGSPGVQIIYRRPGGPTQTLYYFKADLSNGKECRNFLSWLGDLGPGSSYLKAASYLLPLDAFSETRNFLLNTSQLILQDDSGIPYRDFKTGEWRIQLFGVYTDPLAIFQRRREPELQVAYGTIYFKGMLPFGAGYHVNANDANLLLATRDLGNALQQSMPAMPLPSSAVAMSAVASPTPRAKTTPSTKPTPVKIRKALPVPIRKAIPVRTPKPIMKSVVHQAPFPTPTPIPDVAAPVAMPVTATPSTPPEISPQTMAAPTPVPTIPVTLSEPPPEPPLDSVGSTAPQTPPSPDPVPTTTSGKPID